MAKGQRNILERCLRGGGTVTIDVRVWGCGAARGVASANPSLDSRPEQRHSGVPDGMHDLDPDFSFVHHTQLNTMEYLRPRLVDVVAGNCQYCSGELQDPKPSEPPRSPIVGAVLIPHTRCFTLLSS